VLFAGLDDYRERVVYQAYDVTGLLQPGKKRDRCLVGAGMVFNAAAVVRPGE